LRNLAESPHHFNSNTRECKAFIEIPKGGRNKFKYEPEFDSFALSGLLPQGLAFPFDFGFIPSTLGPDGDPVDIMVLMDEPTHVGCLLDVRIIGVIEADQKEDGEVTRNDRVIAVATKSYGQMDVKSIEEVKKPLLDQVEEFFVSYNKSRGKEFKVRGRYGPDRAAAIIERGIAAHQSQRPNGKEASQVAGSATKR